MTLSYTGHKTLAKLNAKLPPYCVVRKRKGYFVVYFHVPKRLRPDGWPDKTPEVGRTNKHTIEEIIESGKAFNESLRLAKLGVDAPPRVRKGSLANIVSLYKKSEHYTNLKPSTQHGYLHFLKTIERWSEQSGHPHVRQLTAVGVSAFLDNWKDTPRTRAYYKSVLSKLYAVAIRHGFVSHNIIKEIQLPIARKKREKFSVWTLDDINKAIDTALDMNKPNIARAIAIAWEAFRQTDVFNLQEPRDYKNGHFRFFTSKTDELVQIRASKRTTKLLSSRPKTQLLLSVNDVTSKVWTKDAFYHQLQKVLRNANLSGHQFRKIRNSSAIRALKADLTNAEFKQRYGWSRKTVEQMRDLYTDIDQEIIDTGADKIEKYEERFQ